MTLRKRLDRLEAVRGARPTAVTGAAMAELAARLDALAARKARGDATAQHDIEALTAALARGDLAEAEALLAAACDGGRWSQ